MNDSATSTPPIGRPRDAAIDDAVLDATLSQLARDGYVGLSIASIAAAAGTTRSALYRRWPNKDALVVDAVAKLANVAPPLPTGDPFSDLVAELQHFRHCISDASSLPLAGVMLGEGVDPEIRDRYRKLIVEPRRERIRSCIKAASDMGAIDEDADVQIAATMMTGSWYAMALAGKRQPADWAHRVAALIWRACGGTPPQ